MGETEPRPIAQIREIRSLMFQGLLDLLRIITMREGSYRGHLIFELRASCILVFSVRLEGRVSVFEIFPCEPSVAFGLLLLAHLFTFSFSFSKCWAYIRTLDMSQSRSKVPLGVSVPDLEAGVVELRADRVATAAGGMARVTTDSEGSPASGVIVIVTSVVGQALVKGMVLVLVSSFLQPCSSYSFFATIKL
jgi:hypothetical protein